MLFLVGLLLLGGSLARLGLIVTAFTIGHSITLSLAALGVVTPPGRLVEPAIALSIVLVGVDNLLVPAAPDAGPAAPRPAAVDGRPCSGWCTASASPPCCASSGCRGPRWAGRCSASTWGSRSASWLWCVPLALRPGGGPASARRSPARGWRW